MAKKRLTIDQAKDTGLAATLICLLVTHFRHDIRWVAPSIVFLVFTMVWPNLFRWPARFWFGFSHAIGTVVSKVLLTIVFFVVATPMGMVRQLLRKDSMQIRRWRQGKDTVFRTRDHTYAASDLKNPY